MRPELVCLMLGAKTANLQLQQSCEPCKATGDSCWVEEGLPYLSRAPTPSILFRTILHSDASAVTNTLPCFPHSSVTCCPSLASLDHKLLYMLRLQEA